jgi:hypothetical protein
LIAREDLGKMDVVNLPLLSFYILVPSHLYQIAGLVFLCHTRLDFLNCASLYLVSHTSFPLFHSYQSVRGRHLSKPRCSAQQLVALASSGLLLKQSGAPGPSEASP